jgi:hypothetical protein
MQVKDRFDLVRQFLLAGADLKGVVEDAELQLEEEQAVLGLAAV